MKNSYQYLQGYPLGVTDLKVVQRLKKKAEIYEFDPEKDWKKNKHHLIIFFPEVFTPVCESELGRLTKWIKPFDDLGIQVIASCTDLPAEIAEWFNTEEKLLDAKYPIFSSGELPDKLGLLLANGRAKRSSVFLMNTGEVVKQEHFFEVSRSFIELHRMAYGFINGERNTDTWKNPFEKDVC